MRCGVFLCECGGNISGVLDLPALADTVKGADGVVSVAVNQFMCGIEGRKMIEQRGRGARARPFRDRFLLASLSGPDLRADRPRAAPGRERRRLRQPARGLLLHPPARAREGAEEGREDRRRGDRACRAAIGSLAKRTFLHRSALVVGGGIAGLSAAEELAEAGIEVHLVESQQSIGGYMARLSKTFPTEDCAMCSLAPRLTNAATDSHIRIHALSNVTKITGPPGEFRVTIRHEPRYVSEDCVGCGQCAQACPVSLANEFDFGVSERKAISRPFPNAVPAELRHRPSRLGALQVGLPGSHLRTGLRGPGRTRSASTRPTASPPSRTPSRRSAAASARTSARAPAPEVDSTSRSRSPESSASWPIRSGRPLRCRPCRWSTTRRWR